MKKLDERGCAPHQFSQAAALFVLSFLIAGTAGCAFWTPERTAAIHAAAATALEIACKSGGGELVATKLDELAAEGKITQEQAEDLKNAAQNGYYAFLARLRELSTPVE